MIVTTTTTNLSNLLGTAGGLVEYFQGETMGNNFTKSYGASQSQQQPYHFWRINEKVSYNKDELIPNPVDRLRIKVARWLNND